MEKLSKSQKLFSYYFSHFRARGKSRLILVASKTQLIHLRDRFSECSDFGSAQSVVGIERGGQTQQELNNCSSPFQLQHETHFQQVEVVRGSWSKQMSLAAG